MAKNPKSEQPLSAAEPEKAAEAPEDNAPLSSAEKKQMKESLGGDISPLVRQFKKAKDAGVFERTLNAVEKTPDATILYVDLNSFGYDAVSALGEIRNNFSRTFRGEDEERGRILSFFKRYLREEMQNGIGRFVGKKNVREAAAAEAMAAEESGKTKDELAKARGEIAEMNERDPKYWRRKVSAWKEGGFGVADYKLAVQKIEGDEVHLRMEAPMDKRYAGGSPFKKEGAVKFRDFKRVMDKLINDAYGTGEMQGSLAAQSFKKVFREFAERL